MKVTQMVKSLLLSYNLGKHPKICEAESDEVAKRIMTTFETYMWKIKSRDMVGIWEGSLHLKILNNQSTRLALI